MHIYTQMYKAVDAPAQKGTKQVRDCLWAVNKLFSFAHVKKSRVWSPECWSHIDRKIWFSRRNDAFKTGMSPGCLITDVAKQHDVCACIITFGVFASSRASFWLDKLSRKLLECFIEDFPKLALVPRLEFTTHAHNQTGLPSSGLWIAQSHCVSRSAG